MVLQFTIPTTESEDTPFATELDPMKNDENQDNDPYIDDNIENAEILLEGEDEEMISQTVDV